MLLLRRLHSLSGGPSGSDLSSQSPTKTQLKEAVEYLEDKVGQTKVQAEEYVQAKVHDIKQDTMAKAKHLLADQKAYSNEQPSTMSK